ncbi:MAG: hypothetical protein LBQ66_02595 [Planctomycetaceae bacterium]|nr:hypothetical protein [Planctomycetaceae bacterium]
MYKILISFPVKIFCFLFLVLMTGYWLGNGWDWCRFQSKDDTNKIVDELTKNVRQKNPEAAAALEKIRQDHNINALAATLQERNNRDGIDGLVRLAQERNNARETFDLQLADMALEPALITNVDQRLAFLNAHANHLQQLNLLQKNIKDDSVRNFADHHISEYLLLLKKASENPDEWRRVRENPMMVQLIMSGVDPNGLEFYDREKEWLDNVLYLLLTSIDFDQSENQSISLSVTESEQGKTEKEEWTKHIVQIIQKNHPYFRDAVKEYLQDPQIDTDTGIAFVFDMFERYGQSIQICINKGGIPLEELLGVLFANPDYCERYASSPENLAARLINIRQQMPEVWEHADRQLVFQLADDVPNIANELCRKFGTDDIAAFLYLKYDDAIQPAANAINQFGDLAIYILNRYSESKLFKNYLKDSTLGVRIVPYAAMFEDHGLERLEANHGWLDKYFDTEGNPKQEQWWGSLPGGGAVTVAGNWAKGYPSEWSEIGWAALDVADAALLIASLGASAPATAAKTTGTTSVKVGTKAVARDTVTTVLKSGTRLTPKGSRNLAKTQKTRLFRQGIRTLTKQPFHLVPQGGRLFVQTAKTVTITPVKKLTGSIYRSAHSVYTSWQHVSPATRQIIYRSLLATGLVITIWHRTIPALKTLLPQAGEKIGALIADSAKIGAETLASVLNGFLERLLETPSGSRVVPYVVFFAVLSGMIMTTIYTGYRLFWRRIRT